MPEWPWRTANPALIIAAGRSLPYVGHRATPRGSESCLPTRRPVSQNLLGVVDRQSSAETPVERNFEDFFMRVHARAIAHAERFLDYDDAREAVQMAAVEMWGRWSELRPEQKNAGYFVLAVHNRVTDGLRRQDRYVALTEEHDLAVEVTPPQLEPATDEMDTADLLSDMVAAMPLRRREVWTLVMEQGLTYEQVAAQLGLRYPTIGRHMSLARETLRKGLLAAGIGISGPSARQMLPSTTGGNDHD